jgi:3-phenylpropionate/trans-cinnamate dioxygenase ferredoxin subunit
MRKILLEIKVLFGLGKWYKVFNSSEDAIKKILDKKSVLVHLGNTEICVARIGNQFSAFINECPHHQMPLNRGSYNNNEEWICPYHRHCFNLKNGKNMTMPESHDLKMYPIKTTSKGLFVYKSN